MLKSLINFDTFDNKSILKLLIGVGGCFFGMYTIRRYVYHKKYQHIPGPRIKR